MRNPCQICEGAHLDKEECSLGCERRHEYCKHLGISVTGSPVVVIDSQLQQKVCQTLEPQKQIKGKEPHPSKPPKPFRVSKPLKPKTCKHHSDRIVLDPYRRLCIDCVRERTEKKERSRAKSIENIKQWSIREENRRAKALAKAMKPPYDWHAPRGMRSKGGRLEKATALMKEGRGNREVCRLTGMSKSTAAKLRRVLEEKNGGPFLCPCGKPATHKGRCPPRIAKSPKRQVYMVITPTA